METLREARALSRKLAGQALRNATGGEERRPAFLTGSILFWRSAFYFSHECKINYSYCKGDQTMSYSPSESAAIGHRAAALVKARAAAEGTSIWAQTRKIDVSRQQFYQWARVNGVAPSALILSRMAYYGYDVGYILTGQES